MTWLVRRERRHENVVMFGENVIAFDSSLRNEPLDQDVTLATYAYIFP